MFKVCTLIRLKRYSLLFLSTVFLSTITKKGSEEEKDFKNKLISKWNHQKNRVNNPLASNLLTRICVGISLYSINNNLIWGSQGWVAKVSNPSSLFSHLPDVSSSSSFVMSSITLCLQTSSPDSSTFTREESSLAPALQLMPWTWLALIHS